MIEGSYTFSFDALMKGELGLTATCGAYFAESASYCLHSHTHPNPVQLSLSGDRSGSGDLVWNKVGEAHRRTHADLQEAVEFGACAIGIIIAVQLTELSCVERSVKGTGIDFWLVKDSDERGIFQRSARLEASGILTGGETAIRARVKQKLAQTNPTDKAGLPAYVAVVEFGSPQARFLAKSGKVGEQ
jgi:hypothetical protein